MSDLKTERQLNLLFVLLNANQPIEREEIRRRVPGYFDKSNEAFERMFERDKEDLRDLGIPIEAVTKDILQEDLFGYVIKKDDWLMPELTLSAQERTLLNVAASAWATAQTNATNIGSALNKAVNRLVPRNTVEQKIEFSLSANGQKIETILQAQSLAKCVEFNYLSPSKNETEYRLVAPWRIFMSQGNTYLIGFDQNKGDQRTFRLTRIVGEVAISSEDALEPIPENLSVSEIVSNWDELQSYVENVELEIAHNAGGELRLLANRIELGQDFDKVFFSKIDHEILIEAVLKNCDSVRVISPNYLVQEVTNRLNLAVANEK